MPLCPRCGTPNESTRTFCKYCGERLTANAPVAAEAPRRQFNVDPRLAIGGGVVAVLVVGAIAFAAATGGARPSPTPAPSQPTAPPVTAVASPSLPTSSPPASVSVPPSESPAVTDTPVATDTSEPSETVVPSETPSAEPTASLPTTPESIAFYAVRNGQADVFTIPPEGGDLTNITNDALPDSDPKWSPDGRLLAFDSRRDDGERNIWVYKAATAAFTRLTSDTGANNSFPTWSPDGQQIAYVHDGEIWILNAADGSDPHAITTGASDGRPSWGVTGQILFQRTTGSESEIWTVPADGSTEPEVVISADAGGGRQPAWSPDASQIAYVVRVDGVLRIAVADGTGATPTTITPAAPCPCQFPTWSPDGTRIAFSAGTAKAEQIFVVDASGGRAKRVTDGAGQNLVPGWGS
jgi:Tol biopolymer transport system component